jgi:type VII secretion integral membrane protein EccD
MLAAVVLLTPAGPILAIRLGRIPVPAIPESAGEILDDRPNVPAPQVFAAVARADEILTGMLLGVSVAGGTCLVMLGVVDGVAVPLLVAVSTLTFLLRTRLYLATRQRVPLLVAGLAGAATLTIEFARSLDPAQRSLVPTAGLAVVAAAVVTLGLVYSRRGASPYVSRFLELFDAVLLMSVIPITCAAAGVFQAVRGNFG